MRQSYTNLEIIAVDDGSRDQSKEILLRLQKEDRRIVILEKENGGLSDARNFGIRHSHGEYLAFVDGDDVIHPDMISHLQFALNNAQRDIAVADMEYFYEDHSRSFSSGGSFTCTNCQTSPNLIAINNSACNKLYRKYLFEDMSFPKGKYYEDLAVIPILLYKAKQVVKVDEALYYYRQRKGSIAHSANPKIFDIYDALDGIYQYVQQHGNESEILGEIRRLYIIHGLLLTTLRIRDFDDKALRKQYLQENMQHLAKSYPNFWKDKAYRKASFKQKLIYGLLRKGKFDSVLKIYDR